jgi:hypothetical protein
MVEEFNKRQRKKKIKLWLKSSIKDKEKKRLNYG